MIKLQGLGHVLIAVRDLERSKAFYTGLLGEKFSPASLAPSAETEEIALLAASLHAHEKARSVRPVANGGRDGAGARWKFADRGEGGGR